MDDGKSEKRGVCFLSSPFPACLMPLIISLSPVTYLSPLDPHAPLCLLAPKRPLWRRETQLRPIYKWLLATFYWVHLLPIQGVWGGGGREAFTRSSCHSNWVTLQPCTHLWPMCDLAILFEHFISVGNL